MVDLTHDRASRNEYRMQFSFIRIAENSTFVDKKLIWVRFLPKNRRKFGSGGEGVSLGQKSDPTWYMFLPLVTPLLVISNSMGRSTKLTTYYLTKNCRCVGVSKNIDWFHVKQIFIRWWQGIMVHGLDYSNKLLKTRKKRQNHCWLKAKLDRI